MEDYEDGGGENHTIVDLLHFKDDKNQLDALVDGPPDDLDFELSEDMEALDVGGMHLGNMGNQHGLYEVDKGEYDLDDF